MTSGLTTSQLRAGTKPTETEMAKDLTNIERYKEAASFLWQCWFDLWYLYGTKMDYDGIVEGYTPDSIKIARAHLVRVRFEFRAVIRTPRQP
ncbi:MULTISPECIES: hypothetical protein [Paenibacillus]|jgi:hypothetical protein|uniref:hypothetical protein n=1 Tax=Paenibacillus TaxID=44249 RepID=UPI00096C0336|nr:hypothetical protein [Paenibacillus odorifer]MEC0131284.1 hypothetical protein [Paenibacillus odorifer]MEC0222077.1 hypothetical protein [Paenibacillus odorifer]OMC95501.1 hypothetical protein BJP46_29685 [Paenibacillus odorifer]OME51770.1 hypothetical protein BSK59_19790 [Paenibacillus odorifer]